jgi:hypothetical protein
VDRTEDFAAAFEEAKSFGGDGVTTSTIRTAEETEIGIYWAYDGTPSLCAPPRLYNQIVMNIADQMGTTSNPADLARLLALTNTAMADACIAIWESKYFYQYWRPITAIREADPGTGPTGLGDGNPSTTGDPNFSPLGAPASNLTQDLYIGNSLKTLFPLFRLTPPVTAGSAARFSKPCASFTRPTVLPSRLCRTNSMESRTTMPGTCGL